jgi:hypothetical protein
MHLSQALANKQEVARHEPVIWTCHSQAHLADAPKWRSGVHFAAAGLMLRQIPEEESLPVCQRLGIL